ncbi:MAG: response regulator transcription factor [Actinomycetota bacterium]|nr:response regulator transcription factor [Actinomycetota bacterium]
MVDDNHVVRMGLTMLLDTLADITVLGEATNGQECVDAVDTLSPDVVLLDVRMPGSFDGVVTARMIADRTNVLMLTYSDDQTVVRGALDAGAKGYLVHGDATADDISSAIRTVAAGRTHLNGRAAEVLVNLVNGSAPAAAVETPTASRDSWNMTNREREIMELLADGRNNTAIAKELFISPSTLKNHITRIFDKLGVASRSEAIVLWLKGAESQE